MESQLHRHKEEQQTGHQDEAGKHYQDWDGEGRTRRLEAGDTCLQNQHRCREKLCSDQRGIFGYIPWSVETKAIPVR